MPNPTPTPAPAHRQHAFKGLADWIEVFRAGSHTDSKGRACSFSESDLDQMAANVALGAPPAVLGHPKHNDPAYAWANELKRDGPSLFAKFSDINPDFEAGVDSGAYRNRSVSIVRDPSHGWRVQHIGWLGAAPPAIVGLKPVDLAEFSAHSADAHEFMDTDDLPIAWAFGDVAALFRRLRDWLISKDGLEAADQVLTDYQITGISDASTRIRDAALREPEATATANPLFNQPTGAAMSFQQADLDRVAAETEARIRAETQAQFAAQTTALQQMQSERQAERIGAQIAGWKAGGLVTPAEEPGLREFMATVEAAGAEFTFTAATGEVKKTPAQWFAEFMAGRKPVVKLGQQPAGGDSAGAALDTGNAEAIAGAARMFQAAEAAAGRTISIDQAVTRVIAQAAASA